jgi:hypothetical protein
MSPRECRQPYQGCLPAYGLQGMRNNQDPKSKSHPNTTCLQITLGGNHGSGHFYFALTLSVPLASVPLGKALPTGVLPRNRIVATLIQSRQEGSEGCITYAKRVYLLLVVRMSLLEPSRATPVFRFSCFMGSPVRDRGRTGTLMTRSSSSARAGECGRSTARPSRAAREISLSSKPVRSIASRLLVIRRSYNSTFTSVLASSKRTCKVEATSSGEGSAFRQCGLV